MIEDISFQRPGAINHIMLHMPDTIKTIKFSTPHIINHVALYKQKYHLVFAR